MADGGTGDCWQAGAEPPDPPADTDSLLEHFDIEDVAADRCHVIRVSLSAASEEYALRVVEELRKEMDVLGTTLTLDVGPEAPGIFDVVVVMDYAPTTVTGALVEPSEVDAVTVVRPDRPTAGGADAEVPVAEGADEPVAAGADDAAVDAAMAEVDAQATEEEPADEGADADAGSGAADDATSAGGAADADADEGGDGDEEPTSQPPEEEFEELKSTTERVGYDELVSELEETTIPGEFRDEVDLGPIIEDPPGDAEGTAPPTADPSAQAQGAGGQIASGDGGKQLAAPAGELAGDQIVEALVTAIEEDALSDDQRRTIADAFDMGPPKTLLVRIDHLQREVDELTAYKQSLEGFIDEYGTGGGLVEQIREALSEFTEDVAEMEAELAELDDQVADLDDRAGTVEDVEERLDRQAERYAELEGVTDRVDAVESELSQVDDLGALADRIEELSAATERVEELDDLAERVDALEEVSTRVRALERLSARAKAIDSLEERLDVLQSELDAVRQTAETGAGADVEDRLDAIDEEISALGSRMSVVESETVEAVDELGDDVARVEERLAAIEEWRERISMLLASE